MVLKCVYAVLCKNIQGFHRRATILKAMLIRFDTLPYYLLRLYIVVLYVNCRPH